MPLRGVPRKSAQPTCSQQYDGTQRCPQQSFTYDSHGNLFTYDKGNGAWSLGYDTYNNRVTSATDPDGVTLRTCYDADGSVSATQTATQYANDSGVICGSHSTSYTYDLDGNKLAKVHHYNNVAGTTTSWYDGDGLRLRRRTGSSSSLPRHRVRRRTALRIVGNRARRPGPHCRIVVTYALHHVNGISDPVAGPGSKSA